jgi:hypothetical protein
VKTNWSLILVWSLWAGGAVIADQTSGDPAVPEKPAAASLDDLLLDDLDNQLLEGLSSPAAKSPPAPSPPSNLDRQLLDQLG